MNAPWWLGIDVGGTNLRAAAVTATGTVIGHRSAPVRRAGTVRPAFGQLVALATDICAEQGSPPVAVGIGSTGPLDLAGGCITNHDILPPDLNGPVVEVLSSALGRSVVLLNDADAAALAEAWIGAGRGRSCCAVVTVGTGIGLGIVRDGVVLTECSGRHAEGGHGTIAFQGRRCACGDVGCWESYCSGPAISRAMSERSGRTVSTSETLEAARVGQEDALAVIDDVAAAMAAGIRNVISVVSPDVVALGGGVMRAGDLFLPRILDALKRSWLLEPERLTVTLAELGDNAGVVGAARAAMTASRTP